MTKRLVSQMSRFAAGVAISLLFWHLYLLFQEEFIKRLTHVGHEHAGARQRAIVQYRDLGAHTFLLCLR